MSPIALVVDGVAGWLESRDDNMEVRPQNNKTRNGNGLFQSATNQTTSQQMFYNDLRFSAAKSIRTSTIILASFNIIAAFATAVGILLESYFREKRNNRQYRFWRNGFTFVPEGEVYPLILSVGIFIQSLVFAGAQSTGLDGLFGPGCTMMAQVMLPAVFLAPYIQLVFAVEIALRALRKQPFAPRGKWNVAICSAAIGLLVLAKFLVADFDRSPNFCLTSLFWFVAHYSTACFGLLTAIASILLLCIVVIFVKLSRSIQIEVTARVAASRMVYYLALALISIGFMLPYFYVLTFMNDRGQNNNSLNLSMVAAVVANISGLMTGGLYLFLKSNTLSTIGPRDKAGEYENRRARYKIERRYTMDETDTDSIGTYGRQIIYPVTGPGSLCRMNSNSILMALEEEKVCDAQSRRSASTTYSRRAPGSLRSFRSMATSAFMPKAPERARISTGAGGHMRKQSYSLFPNNAGTKSSLTLLPATTYSPNDQLKPPLSMGNFANFRHRRDSSLISSATVQIGLRLSSVEDTVIKNTIVTTDPHVYNLDCPHVLKELEEKGILKRGALTTPTKLETETKLVVESPRRDPIKDAKMKTLPPVPRLLNTQSIVGAPAEEQEVTLSPSVYSPQSTTKLRLPSPRGASFTAPPKSTSPWSPAVVPPLQLQRRGMGDTTPPPADPKDAWI